jgi:DnaJ-class molecular chaperone
MKKTLKKEKYEVAKQKSDDFYSILSVNTDSNIATILKSYSKTIKPYFNLSVLKNEDIEKIKLLKVGLYVLSNYKLKNIYDNSIKNVPKNIPRALDDNNFMNIESNNNSYNKDHSVLSDRVFEFAGKMPSVDNMSRGAVQTRDNDKLGIESTL